MLFPSESQIIRAYYKVKNGGIKLTRKIGIGEHNKNIKSLINNNHELENKYSDQRVFIIANGPSIKDENISALKGEYILLLIR